MQTENESDRARNARMARKKQRRIKCVLVSSEWYTRNNSSSSISKNTSDSYIQQNNRKSKTENMSPSMYQHFICHLHETHTKTKIKTNVKPLRFHQIQCMCVFLSRLSLSRSHVMLNDAINSHSISLFSLTLTRAHIHSLSPSYSPQHHAGYFNQIEHSSLYNKPFSLSLHISFSLLQSAFHAACRRKCVYLCVCEWQFVCMQNTRNAFIPYIIHDTCTMCSTFDSNLNSVTPYKVYMYSILLHSRSECVQPTKLGRINEFKCAHGKLMALLCCPL